MTIIECLEIACCQNPIDAAILVVGTLLCALVAATMVACAAAETRDEDDVFEDASSK